MAGWSSTASLPSTECSATPSGLLAGPDRGAGLSAKVGAGAGLLLAGALGGGAAAGGRAGRNKVSTRYCVGRHLCRDYRLGRTLGQGASVPVKLATGRTDGRSYAVKSFPKERLSPEELMLLKSEAEIHLSLDHPHVARLETVLETTEEVHLVMEHLAGGELHQRLSERRRFPDAEASSAARQMLLAVAYLHARQVAHRDLKLENWMYEAAGGDHLKLIDFGLARCRRDSPGSKMSRACGSVHYVAPEVLKNSYTEKADMWSLGVILYMLLAGCSLFQGKDDEEVVGKIKEFKFVFSPRFRESSGPARDLVQRLLVLDPEARLSAEQALLHPWVAARSRSQEPLDLATFRGFQGFRHAPCLRRAAFSAMAWSLTSHARDGLQDQFLAAATESRGTIPRAQLVAMLHAAGASADEAEAIAEALVEDAEQEDGELDYSGFLAAALCGRSRELHEDLLMKAFSRFDRDGRGHITAEDLRAVLGEDAMLRDGGNDQDRLDYEAFRAIVRGVTRDGAEVPFLQARGLSSAVSGTGPTGAGPRRDEDKKATTADVELGSPGSPGSPGTPGSSGSTVGERRGEPSSAGSSSTSSWPCLHSISRDLTQQSSRDCLQSEPGNEAKAPSAPQWATRRT